MTSYEYDNSTISEAFDYFYVSMSPTLRIWLMIVIDFISLTCSLTVFYQMFTKKVLRESLHNHAFIALTLTGLGTQLIDIPFYVNYLRLGYVWPSTPLACLVWWYVDIGLFEATIMLVVWASLERHILIFHERWLSTGVRRYLFHFFPIMIFAMYPLLFTLLCLIFITCDDGFVFDYSNAWCSFSPCFYRETLLSFYDTMMHWVLPNIVILLLNVTLIIRVVWYRSIRLRQTIRWRKHRKMIIQLLSVSLIFVMFNLPVVTYYLLMLFKALPENVNPQIYAYFYLICYLPVLLMPLFVLFSMPKEYWWNVWKNVFFNQQHRRQIANENIPT